MQLFRARHAIPLILSLALASPAASQTIASSRLGMSLPVAPSAAAYRSPFDSTAKKHSGAVPAAIIGGLVGLVITFPVAGVAKSDGSGDWAGILILGALVCAGIGYFLAY